jgi:hypothetical protein
MAKQKSTAQERNCIESGRVGGSTSKKAAAIPLPCSYREYASRHEELAREYPLDTASQELMRARAVIDLVYCLSTEASGGGIEMLDADTLCSVMGGLREHIDKAIALIDATTQVSLRVALPAEA